ncbi:MCP four helix bundle domain-containing protein [Undibacterium seohonense]|uniref:MCP four helix bundle domain-containing protein n=1 Tax=Undibacterium seohonense TaxID=1344950 RepID=A0ABR6X2P6_9BURK|nr:methyl-accepting chemotaxis protein [Undibacterium seohonense]MBC3806938.1 MCP four helix bundle domain-containing protein [Undibacterium seohonense]
MQAFYDLRIATKLMLGFITVLLLTCFLGIFSITQLTAVNRAADEIGNDWMPSSINGMGMKESVSRMRSQEAQLATAENGEDVKKYQDRTNEAIDAFRSYHTLSMKSADSSQEKKALDDLLGAFNDYAQISSKIGNFAKEGNTAEALAVLRKESSDSNKKMRSMLDKIVDDHIQGGQTAFAESSVKFTHARNLIIGVMLASIAIGLIMAVWLAKIVSSPLKSAVDLAQSIASGDLTQKVEAESTCETGQLIRALSDMNNSLLNVVTEVRAGTEQINEAASEIANGNLDLSSRTEEQASSLEETASSMEEITATVKHNSDNARQANILSQTATSIAEKGGSVVSEVVSTMTSINDSSKKIVDIISVIDGIAFQTNILALNAAVEAARAGEQGRGFAVVASEVRSLAQRSASAAKEIKELINDSVEKVEQGTRLVDAAGTTMQEVVQSVKRVSDMISEITAAGQEQSSGIDQINQAIIQMDSITQQNSALVEEAAAASATMQDQAAKLVDVVSVFKLDNNGTYSAPKASAAPRRASSSPTRSNKVQPPRIKASPVKHTEKAASADSWEEF